MEQGVAPSTRKTGPARLVSTAIAPHSSQSAEQGGLGHRVEPHVERVEIERCQAGQHPPQDPGGVGQHAGEVDEAGVDRRNRRAQAP